MSKQKIKVNLQVLESEYQLMCEAHERNALIEAADNLNMQLAEMRRNNPRVPIDRLVMMGAIQMAFDLQQERETLTKEVRIVNESAKRLADALDAALAEANTQES